MVRTVYWVAASLDGFVVDGPAPFGPRSPGEPSSPGEPLRPGAPAERSGDPWPEDPSDQEFLSGVGAVAMGAGTYRTLLAVPESWPYGKIPVWVFTRHEFPGISGADITFVRGDVEEFHPDIVYDAGEKNVFLAGGANLAGQFMDCGLIDEMFVTVVPVALGAGRPMLPVARVTQPGALLETRSEDTGLVQLHYGFGDARGRQAPA